MDDSHGALEIENFPLRGVIQFAYGVKDFQFSGPAWLADVCYDISAKPPVGAQRAQLRTMLRALLAERFKLVVHHDSKLVPAYGLTAAKGGVKFHEATGPRGYFTGRPGLIQGTAVSMKEIASALAGQLRCPVADETGLTSVYDIKLEWTPDQLAATAVPGDAAPLPDPGPSLATALREQLGLALKTEKAPVDVVIVDSIERIPTGN